MSVFSLFPCTPYLVYLYIVVHITNVTVTIVLPDCLVVNYCRQTSGHITINFIPYRKLNL